MITSISDFNGKYLLSKGIYDNAKIQDYIDRYEPRYLKELFGVTLFNEFMSDLDSGIPQSPNFQKIFYPFSEDLGSYYYSWNSFQVHNTILDSEGLKEMLKGFIYFEYAKDLFNQMTPYGQTKPLSENSEVVNTIFSTMYNRYNEAVRTYSTIQQYIMLNQGIAINQVLESTILNSGTGYINSTGISALNGSGTGCLVDIEASGIGSVNQLPNLLTIGSGYSTQTEVPCLTITGSGSGLILNIYDNGSGGVDYFDVFENGSGYEIGDTLTIDSGNQDATIEITGVDNGEIQSISISNGGQNYLVGDILTIDSGDQNAEIEVSFIGAGNYKNFRGLRKLYNYWI
jgi:hypothetical protein